MDALTFGNPELAWLALVALAVTAWGVLRVRRADKALARLGTGKVVHRLVASRSPGRALARELLIGVALLLLVGAATRPRYGLRETEVSNAGIDIVFAVDASKSMLVRDIVPNRLQGTSLEISGLLERLAGGRVALVPFAGIPFVQCPLTTDHEVIRTYLAELRTEDMPVGGTNLGRAIAVASDVLTGSEQNEQAKLQGNLVPQFKGSKHKAIVIFSDGEAHEGDAVEAAKKAAAKGIRVFTVGVGSSFGDPVPIVAADGSVTGTLKDNDGNPIFSKLDLDLLASVADASGGKSFHYANKTVVPELFAALDALEKAEYRERFKMLGEDRYQWLLGPALLLLLIALSLSERRRAVVPVVAALLLLFAGPTARQAAAQTAEAPAAAAADAPAAGSPEDERTQAERRHDRSLLDRENPDVAEGRDLLAAGKAGEARAAFEQAQKTRPEHAILWYDLAIAQAVIGLHSEAAVAFGRCLSALDEADPELEADLHYGAGTNQLLWGQAVEKKNAAEANVNAGGGAAPDPAPTDPPPGEAASKEDPSEHYRLAVESLQKALVVAPGRAEVRKNLEIAVLLAYPPCERRDTAYEPNERPTEAKPLKLSTEERETSFDLRSCPLDRDVLSLDLQRGDRLTASIEIGSEEAPQAIDPLLGAAGGEKVLDLALLDATGMERLRGSEPGKPAVTEVQRTVIKDAERLLLDVRNVTGVEAPYKLEVKVLPACERLEDKLEPNDSIETARAVGAGQPLALRLCPRNDDHLAVGLARGEGLIVRAKHKLELGADQIEIDILDRSGRVLRSAAKRGEGMIARLANAPMDGAYIVRVRGGIDTEADVELQLEVTPPCALRDDAYEQNDAAIAGNRLDKDELRGPIEDLHLCPGDDDWYRVELAEGESLFVDLVAQIEELPDVPGLAGALTVTVYDAAGEVWGEGRGAALGADAKALNRTTAVLAPPPGTYWVRVTGGGVADPIFPLPPLPDGAREVEVDAPVAGPGGQAGGQAGGLPPPGPAQPAPPGIRATPLGPGGGQPGAAGAAPSGPSKIRKVILPEGYPMPAVDPVRAQLDLPYRLGLRVLPPCPEGNDEQEPDDKPSEAKPIEVGSERLYRVCKGDQDWIEIQQKAGQHVQVSARYDFAHGALSLKATSEDGTGELAVGQTQAPALPGKSTGKDDTPAARRGRTATTGLMVKGEKKDRVIKIQVLPAEGSENFYILRVEEPPPPSDNNQQQNNKNDDNKDDKKDDNDENKDDKQDQKDQQDEPQQDENDPKDDKDPAQQQEQEQQEALRQQMQRHDKNPRNLEAEEALRKSPFRNQRPIKDW
ncbi:MAG: VWA domain-containing protein [Deltaproteobacteria bacterium]|nr:VWA domain-containing protein [Deltaproteobacteria bacterium]